VARIWRFAPTSLSRPACLRHGSRALSNCSSSPRLEDVRTNETLIGAAILATVRGGLLRRPMPTGRSSRMNGCAPPVVSPAAVRTGRSSTKRTPSRFLRRDRFSPHAGPGPSSHRKRRLASSAAARTPAPAAMPAREARAAPSRNAAIALRLPKLLPRHEVVHREAERGAGRARRRAVNRRPLV